MFDVIAENCPEKVEEIPLHSMLPQRDSFKREKEQSNFMAMERVRERIGDIPREFKEHSMKIASSANFSAFFRRPEHYEKNALEHLNLVVCFFAAFEIDEEDLMRFGNLREYVFRYIQLKSTVVTARTIPHFSKTSKDRMREFLMCLKRMELQIHAQINKDIKNILLKLIFSFDSCDKEEEEEEEVHHQR